MAETPPCNPLPQNLANGLRLTMRNAATGVALVTTRDAAGDYHGLAVTTANSLSMSPPSMMFAINHTASAAPVLEQTGLFCVNILSVAHEPILRLFSSSKTRAERFRSPLWHEGPRGLPWLEGCLSSVFCERDAVHEYGSHLVYFGKIIDIFQVEDSACPAPLIWQQGTAMSLQTNC